MARPANPLTDDQCAMLSATTASTPNAPATARPTTGTTGSRRPPTSGSPAGSTSPQRYTSPSVSDAAAIDRMLSSIVYTVP